MKELINSLQQKLIKYLLLRQPEFHLKMTQELLLPTPKFKVGDVVQHLNNDEAFAVVGNYYDKDLKYHLFICDESGKIYGVNPNFYKLCGSLEKVIDATY